jgi:hypothetical protein
VFSPAFTVRLPPGWTVAERDAGAAQLYQQCDTCEHGGEENGEVTLDMGEQSKPVPVALARLRQVKNAVPEPATRVRLGALAGWEFTATRTGKGDVLFEDSGYDTDPTGAPLQVYAFPGSAAPAILPSAGAVRTTSSRLRTGTSRRSPRRATRRTSRPSRT